MNRLEWRTKVLSRRAWRADVDATALAEFNGALNDAVRKLAGDCPAAFVPDVEHVVVLPDATKTTMGRGITRSTTDAYVMELGVFAPGDARAPDITGAWDGVMHIEILTPDGIWRRRQCREFWALVDGKGDINYYVSLDRPWDAPISAAGMDFRIYQPEFYFRDDVTEVLDGMVWDGSGSRFMEVPERAVLEREEQDFQGRRKGRPEKLVRGKHFQLEGPATKPNVSKPDGTVWVGKEPLGAFRFCYTYVWGKKDLEIQDPFGQSDPVWESAPSPVSDAVVLSLDPSTKVRIENLTNIDYMINFDPPPGSLRNGHSGLRKRIYVYRDSTNTLGAFVDQVEARAVAHFLVEVDGTTSSYDWDGSVIPNPFRRLPEVTGYFGYSLVPHQDKAYTIDFRVRRRPANLDNDSDALRVNPAADECLCLLAMYYIAQMDKQFAEADRYLQLYRGDGGRDKGELGKLWALVGNSSKALPPAYWGVEPAQSGYPWEASRGNYFKA